ncbi:MAG: glycogen synthase [Anaerolineae bacterium]|nr:glycogen synthase [Anaerolineae bacterium]
MKALFLAAEAEPFVKIGGLGDVAGSLPPALRRVSIDVRLVLPLHGVIKKQGLPLHFVCEFSLPYKKKEIIVKVFSLEWAGLTVYFIDGTPISPTAPVYSSDPLADSLKYAFFSLAALRLARELDWQPDILHANDWHTALAVYALKQLRATDPFFASTASVLGIHNLPYLGNGSSALLKAFGLSPGRHALLPKWTQTLPLPLGILAADRIVAVSPSYAREILTPEYGSGLDEFLRARADSISGILNGLDLERWDPLNDSCLEKNYSSETLADRKANREHLQAEVGLPIHADAAIMGMVNRMDYQKGMDLLPEALTGLSLLKQKPAFDWQMVILGAGDAEIEARARQLESEFPTRVRVVTRFDVRLSRMIYGGADVIIIPSRYEPCGLTQMIAMRYGCVPLGRSTGGLRDTIFDYDQTRESTGFLFEEATPQSLLGGMIRALKTHRDKQSWRELQLRGMAQDFSWDRSADQYKKLYADVMREFSKNPEGA